jgi:hypothetical protein
MSKVLGYIGFIIVEAIVVWAMIWAIISKDWWLFTSAVFAMLVCVISCYRYLGSNNGTEQR